MHLISTLRTQTAAALLLVSSLFAVPLQAQSDDSTLINITTLEQLAVMRYDLDGDGRPSSAGETSWKAAFTSFSSATVDDADFTRDPSSTYMGYELMEDLDFEDADSYAAATRNNAWVDPANNGTPGTSGWVPIGVSDSASYPFIAIFDGNGHAISNLYINSSASYVGLFGRTSTGSKIRNLGLKHGSVTATGTNAYTGGLVGYNSDFGTISASYATASVTGDGRTGGLVGYNSDFGTISASYATASVTGSYVTGGLVGQNYGGSISASYATASVTAVGNSDTGGLVGRNSYGTISASYATASVTGGTGTYASTGGLVGSNYSGGTISASYATGSVTGGRSQGGLVGRNDGLIIVSYATASVTGETGGSYSVSTGGLVGSNFGSISASYATASVTGSASRGTTISTYTGGLVGYNSPGGTISASYAAASVTATGESYVYSGGLVGYNFRGSISASYATGSVKATGESYVYSGGLVGQNSEGSISASYATASVTGGAWIYAGTGGLVGRNDGLIIVSYATGSVTGGTGTDASTGGLVGYNEDTVRSSYFDSTVNAALNAVGFSNSTVTNVSGKTTAELQAPTTYSTASDAMYYEWNRNIDGDLDTAAADIVWDFGTERRYPKLRAEWDATSGATAAEFGTPQRFIFTDASDVEVPRFSVVESASIATIVGSIKDVSGTSPSFLLTSTAFSVGTTDGAISVASALDFETISTYVLDIGVSNGSSHFTRTVIVRVTQDAAVSATTSDVPAVPTGLVSTPASDTQIDLTWQAPTITGGVAITGYDLEFSTNGINYMDVLGYDGTTLTYQHTGLTAGTTHHYRVAAINSVGTGEYADAVSATTSSGGGADPLREDDLLSSLPRSEDPLRVYPNPASREVQFAGLSSTHRYVYKIYSLAGQEILSGTLRRSSLDVSALANGQYLLVLKSEDGNELLRAQVLVLK